VSRRVDALIILFYQKTMTYNPDHYRLKSVYLPIPLCQKSEAKAKSEYMNFSAYVRKLIVEDLKRDNYTVLDELKRQ